MPVESRFAILLESFSVRMQKLLPSNATHAHANAGAADNADDDGHADGVDDDRIIQLLCPSLVNLCSSSIYQFLQWFIDAMFVQSGIAKRVFGSTGFAIPKLNAAILSFFTIVVAVMTMIAQHP